MPPLLVSRRAILAAPLLTAPLASRVAAAAQGGFAAFLAEIRREAIAQGVRPGTVDFAFRRTEYLPHVIALDRRQPERRMTFDEYIDKVVTPERKDAARRHLAGNAELLARVRRLFGVQPRFIVALWGIESAFGKFMGTYPVVSSLATLGYDGRRSPYFRSELIAALRILDHGDIRPAAMLGSWAGAMGQCQFMPSTYLKYAVDLDGDGRRDIWSDRADVLGSIANFIARLGWRDDETWGRAVRVPPGFDPRLAGMDIRRPLADWSRLGVRKLDARPLPQVRIEASLVLPEGASGPALLVYDNFRTILKWNRSTYFAAAVGYLADSMAAG